MSLLTTDRLVFSADNRYSVVQVNNGPSTMDPGQWNMDNVSWTMDPKQWITDNGPWTKNLGQWIIDIGC